jgi:hypothetical protein
MRLRAGLGLATGMTLLAISGVAFAGKGLGPYYGIKYNSNWVSQAAVSYDQKLALDEERIETINCGGCDTILYGPGTIFHVRNLTKKPVCVAFEFKPNERGMERWGNRGVFYLKGGKKLNKIAGFFDVSDGSNQSFSMSYEYSLTALEPLSDKRCPDIKWALTP